MCACTCAVVIRIFHVSVRFVLILFIFFSSFYSWLLWRVMFLFFRIVEPRDPASKQEINVQSHAEHQLRRDFELFWGFRKKRSESVGILKYKSLMFVCCGRFLWYNIYQMSVGLSYEFTRINIIHRLYIHFFRIIWLIKYIYHWIMMFNKLFRFKWRCIRNTEIIKV